MNPTAYSEKALIDKLGYKPGQTVLLFNPPEWFADYLLKNAVSIASGDFCDYAHGFFKDKAQISHFLQFIQSKQPPHGFWVSWPKKTASLESNVNEQIFREIILPLGWVDTKVCAIDETWSGLLFLRRKN